MSVYHENLYESILLNNAKKYNELNVITGYSSPQFIEKVMLNCNELNINVYIGMSLEGINFLEHEAYINLMEKYNGRINIYYQVEPPSTHIKLYHFKDSNQEYVNYAGSANFSENGFELNYELLVEFNDDVSEIFKKVKSKSTLCTNENIAEQINFYDKHSTTGKIDLTDGANDLTESLGEYSRKPDKRLLFMRKKSYISDFTIPVLLENDHLSDFKGVNAWVEGRKPHLIVNNLYDAGRMFTMDEKIVFYTDDNKKLDARFNERKSTHLEFNPNIHTYISERLSLLEMRPITVADLKAYGTNEIRISKTGKKNHFYLEFLPKIEDARS